MSASSDYVVMNENDEIVSPGDKLSTYDDREAVFEAITHLPEGKYSGLIRTDLGEHNPAVYNLRMVKGETEAQKVAKRVGELFRMVSESEDSELSDSDSPVYKAAYRLLINAIMVGYGLARPKAEQVYAVMVVNADTVADAVHVVATTKPADLPKL